MTTLSQLSKFDVVEVKNYRRNLALNGKQGVLINLYAGDSDVRMAHVAFMGFTAIIPVANLHLCNSNTGEAIMRVHSTPDIYTSIFDPTEE